jgi:alkyl hydroperoxide reductase subunit AhpC
MDNPKLTKRGFESQQLHESDIKARITGYGFPRFMNNGEYWSKLPGQDCTKEEIIPDDNWKVVYFHAGAFTEMGEKDVAAVDAVAPELAKMKAVCMGFSEDSPAVLNKWDANKKHVLCSDRNNRLAAAMALIDWEYKAIRSVYLINPEESIECAWFYNSNVELDMETVIKSLKQLV